jgi:hypothetical protein
MPARNWSARKWLRWARREAQPGRGDRPSRKAEPSRQHETRPAQTHLPRRRRLRRFSISRPA